MGVVCVTTWVFWSNVPNIQLLAWFIAACFLNFFRWLSSSRFDPDDTDTRRTSFFLNLHVFWGFLNGAHWGLIPLFFLTSEVTVYTLFVTSVYTGYVSSAMSTDTAYFRSFFAFALPSSVLFVGRALYEGGELYTALAILVGFFLIMLSYLSLNAQQFFREARELNYRNIALMDELRIQKDTAEQATLAKDQFLAAASHDLRQPLNAVSLFVNALGSMKIEDAGKQVLEKIRQSMQALNGMLHGLLDISRLDSSTVENHPKHIILNDVLSQLVEEYSAKSAAKGVTVLANLDAPLTVYADSILLNRVLRNLIDNAVKYTPSGKVTLSTETVGNHVSLTIADTGIGIPNDQQKNIFNEFYQLNNPERDRQKGLGLGLAIVRRLCDLMEIELLLQSQEGKGTRVVLKLPVGEEQAVDRSEKLASMDLKNLVVAVIDDEQDILEGMEKVLTGWGCDTYAGADYEQLHSKLISTAKKPQLIIADFRLRGELNGIDTIELLREEFNANTPAILITGDTAPDRVKEASDADVEVLYKPIEPEALRQAIFGVLDHPPSAGS